MKRNIFLLILFQYLFIYGVTQTGNLPPVDKSPMDMAYYPNNFPVLKIQDKITEPLAARIVYSRPQKAGRIIFGDLVEYGKVWRVGANEATEIEFFTHVKIGGKKINRGRYTLYAVVNENSWTMIINRETDTWGSFKYDPKKDIAQITLPVQKTDTVVEYLSMVFEKTIAGCNLVIAWDNIKVALPITF